MRYKFKLFIFPVLFFALVSCYLRPSNISLQEKYNIASPQMVYESMCDTTYSHNLKFEYWDMLPNGCRLFYDAMWNFSFQKDGSYEANLYHFCPASSFNYELFEKTKKLFYLDHPERELLSFQNKSLSFYSLSENYCNWGLSSEVDELEYQKKIYEINNEIFKIVCKVNAEPIKREKYKLIHDWIVSNVRYDYMSYEKVIYPDSDNVINENSSNIYGAIVNKLAVCDGISDAYKYICDQCDLDCISMRGVFESRLTINDVPVAHQWNMVYDEEWYLVDCTFDIETFSHQDYFMTGLTIDDRIPFCDINEYLKNDP